MALIARPASSSHLARANPPVSQNHYGISGPCGRQAKVPFIAMTLHLDPWMAASPLVAHHICTMRARVDSSGAPSINSVGAPPTTPGRARHATPGGCHSECHGFLSVKARSSNFLGVWTVRRGDCGWGRGSDSGVKTLGTPVKPKKRCQNIGARTSDALFCVFRPGLGLEAKNENKSVRSWCSQKSRGVKTLERELLTHYFAFFAQGSGKKQKTKTKASEVGAAKKAKEWKHWVPPWSQKSQGVKTLGRELLSHYFAFFAQGSG